MILFPTNKVFNRAFNIAYQYFTI